MTSLKAYGMHALVCMRSSCTTSMTLSPLLATEATGTSIVQGILEILETAGNSFQSCCQAPTAAPIDLDIKPVWLGLNGDHSVPVASGP